MKILLLSPYSDISSMGIRAISASLKKAGFETILIFLPYPYPEIAVDVDFQHRYTKKILNNVAELAKDVSLIGISLMTNYFTMAKDLTDFLHEKVNAPVIWGGIHPSVRPEECLEIADFVCVGEGDEAIVELAKKIDENDDFTDIQNIWSKKNNEIIRNNARPLIKNLDVLPYFDYDFNEQYVLDKNIEEIIPLNKETLHIFLTREKPTKERSKLFYQTIASRGCPYSCTFCSWSALIKKHNYPKIIRRRSNQHLIGELKWVKNELPFIKEITFSDDSFFALSTTEAEKFRDLYKEHVNLPFQCLTEPRTINRKKMDIFVDAGMVNIQIGIQTGSKKIQKMYARPHSNEQLIEMTNIICEYLPKIRIPIYDFILDNPWETIEDKIDTLQLLLKMKRPYFLQLFSLVFFPDIPLYQKAVEEGLIKDERNETYNQQYNQRKITYVNLVMSLFSRKIPDFLLNFFANRNMVYFFDKPFYNKMLQIFYSVFIKIRIFPLLIKRKFLLLH